MFIEIQYINTYNYKKMYVFLLKYGVYKLINKQFKLLPINPMLTCVSIQYSFSMKNRSITIVTKN